MTCQHSLVVTYIRPWRKLWRRVFVLRCWECNLRRVEP